MATKTATVLLGAGAFALALAGLVPATVAPALQKAPATENLETHSRSAAKIYNIASKQLEDIEVDLTRKITPAVDGKGGYLGTSDVAVYHELLALVRVDADGALTPVDARGEFRGIRAGESNIAFDRSTGEGVAGYEDTYDVVGAQTVKFPFGTEKKAYDYLDQTSGRAWPVRYARTTTIDGLEVYVFEGTVPEVSLGQYGPLEGTDTLYSNKARTVYVEPVTGSIVSSETAPLTKVKFADGAVRTVLDVQNLVPTKQTLADRVAAAKDSKRSVQLLGAAPYVLGLLGLVLLGLGVVSLRRHRGTTVDLTDSTPARRTGIRAKLPLPRHEPTVDPARVQR